MMNRATFTLVLSVSVLLSACSDETAATLTFETDATYLTMMNTWIPDDDVTAASVASAAADGLERDISRMDGFLGAAVLQAQDGSNVVVYGQWRDMAAVQAVGGALERGEAPVFAAASAMATLDPHPYRLDSLVGEITIDVVAEELTMINTWTPNEGTTVDDVATALSAGIAADTAAQPGFRAAGVFASLDSFNVRAYGHWNDQASLEAYGAVIGAGDAPVFAQVFGLATSEAIAYDVIAVIRP